MLKKFLFDIAKYKAVDENGTKILLVVDYKNNSFSFEGKGTAKLRRELSLIAKDLLKRKHNVNFADHVRVYWNYETLQYFD